ncbi:MAG: hypothetical protein AVDCRST_MAG87-2316, partial [uncultured Thermomicrobiales bacterium]
VPNDTIASATPGSGASPMPLTMPLTGTIHDDPLHPATAGGLEHDRV